MLPHLQTSFEKLRTPTNGSFFDSACRLLVGAFVQNSVNERVQLKKTDPPAYERLASGGEETIKKLGNNNLKHFVVHFSKRLLLTEKNVHNN